MSRGFVKEDDQEEIGDKAILKRGQEDLVFEIIDIAYH
jgi:hypothetical protein